jgi:hypothetical protein
MTSFLMYAARLGTPAVANAVERKRIDSIVCGGEVFLSRTVDRWARRVFLADREVMAAEATLLRNMVRLALPSSVAAGSTATDSC